MLSIHPVFPILSPRQSILEKLLLLLAISIFLTFSPNETNAQVAFYGKPIAADLGIPWDLVEGPDGYIWFTQRHGAVCRVPMDGGPVDTLAVLQTNVPKSEEGGVLGMALHPDFKDTPIVYISYTVLQNDVYSKYIDAFLWDGNRLLKAKRIYELTPVAFTHLGCRMIILPDYTLMFSNGDQPYVDKTYDVDADVGKICRITLNGKIPSDNPFPEHRMWSRGHRNPQGIVRLPDGTIFAAEHGNVIEDEVNLIVKGGNYGWPLVEGVCDTPEEITICDSLDIIEPAWSSGNSTIAPSGMAYYNHDRYPDLKGSLLLGTLKNARLYQFRVDSADHSLTLVNQHMHFSYGRIRDVLVTSDGRVFFSTSNHESNARYPFKSTDRDYIYELMPYWELAPAVIRCDPDTMRMTAAVGDVAVKTMTIWNDGETSLDVISIWSTAHDTVGTSHWYGNVQIQPGAYYPYDFIYTPTTEGPHEIEYIIPYLDRGNVVYDHRLFHGNTNAGVLHFESEGDELLMGGYVNELSVLNLPLTHKGNQPVSILDVTLSDTTNYTFQRPHNEVVQPGESPVGKLLFHPKQVGNFPVKIELQTDSYRNSVINVLGRAGVNFVQDDNVAPIVVMRPNPATEHVEIIAVNSNLRRVEIRDLLGILVYSCTECPGNSIQWNLTTNGGRSVAAGSYSVSIETDDYATTLPLRLIR